MTDTDVWHATAIGTQPKWENRAQVIAHFIRPGDSVLDLGAGDQKLGKRLPVSCRYIPVDCVDAHGNTFVVDFNQEFKLPDEKFDVVVSAGFVEYIERLDQFMAQLARHCEGAYFLFTYSYTRRAAKPSDRFKKLNALSGPEQCLQFFGNYVDDLREVLELRKQSLFCGTLSLSPRMPANPPSVINSLLGKRTFWRSFV